MAAQRYSEFCTYAESQAESEPVRNQIAKGTQCQIVRRPLQRLWQHWRGSLESGDAEADERLRGTIQSVHISKRSNGQLRGCAYVKFECNEMMAKSMLQDRDNRLLGREVIMDWRLPKKRSTAQWRCWC